MKILARGTVATIAESAVQNGNKKKHLCHIYFININNKQQNKNFHTYMYITMKLYMFQSRNN